jgi:tRNA(fMet)-specific endonuclease VapC
VEVRILLDTSAYSQLARGHRRVATLVRSASSLAFSTIVVGELLAGFRRGARLRENLAELERFLRQPRVLLVPVTWTTADRFGRIAAALRRRGTPIPSNDIWIAAHALETGTELIAFDDHFRYVDGLAWVDPDEGA